MQLNKVTHRKQTKDFVPEPPHKCRMPEINERHREKGGGRAEEEYLEKTCEDNPCNMDLTEVK